MSINLDDLSRLVDAANDLAHCLGDGMTADHAGPVFTCGEADSIADVMRAVGRDEEADIWIRGHAEGDEIGDSHYLHAERDIAELEQKHASQLHDAVRSSASYGELYALDLECKAELAELRAELGLED